MTTCRCDCNKTFTSRVSHEWQAFNLPIPYLKLKTMWNALPLTLIFLGSASLVPWHPLYGFLCPICSLQTIKLPSFSLRSLLWTAAFLTFSGQNHAWISYITTHSHRTHSHCPVLFVTLLLSVFTPSPLLAPLTSHYLSPPPSETLWLWAVRVCQIH